MANKAKIFGKLLVNIGLLSIFATIDIIGAFYGFDYMSTTHFIVFGVSILILIGGLALCINTQSKEQIYIDWKTRFLESIIMLYYKIILLFSLIALFLILVISFFYCLAHNAFLTFVILGIVGILLGVLFSICIHFYKSYNSNHKIEMERKELKYLQNLANQGNINMQESKRLEELKINRIKRLEDAQRLEDMQR